MRHDLYYGAIISLGLHFGLASFSQKIERLVPAKEPEKTYVPFQLSPDPDKVVEAAERSEKQEKPSSASDDFRPPSLPDVPVLAKPDSFVVPVQAPWDGKIDPRLISIPGDRPSGPGGRPSTVFDPSGLDQQPVAKYQAKPVYPFEMKREGESGEVVVDFIVDQNGEVRNAFAVRSTRREFEAAAVQAVAKWKFRPGKKEGRAVNTHMQVPILFRIDEGQE